MNTTENPSNFIRHLRKKGKARNIKSNKTKSHKNRVIKTVKYLKPQQIPQIMKPAKYNDFHVNIFFLLFLKECGKCHKSKKKNFSYTQFSFPVCNNIFFFMPTEPKYPIKIKSN